MKKPDDLLRRGLQISIEKDMIYDTEECRMIPLGVHEKKEEEKKELMSNLWQMATDKMIECDHKLIEMISPNFYVCSLCGGIERKHHFIVNLIEKS